MFSETGQNEIKERLITFTYFGNENILRKKGCIFNIVIFYSVICCLLNHKEISSTLYGSFQKKKTELKFISEFEETFEMLIRILHIQGLLI